MEYGGYNVFTRTWWAINPAWPNGLEPCPGKRRYLARGVSYGRARQLCDQYNSTHKPGRLSRKAEFRCVVLCVRNFARHRLKDALSGLESEATMSATAEQKQAFIKRILLIWLKQLEADTRKRRRKDLWVISILCC
jgi:hypothetical protein